MKIKEKHTMDQTRTGLPRINLRAILLIFATILLCSGKPADFLQDLQEKFDAYKSKYPLVKLYCVFNQPVYSPGDTVFFQCWYLTEEFGHVKGEHIVTLDLFNGVSKTVQKVKFKVKNGVGHSQFVIKSEATPGDYQIVGYTDWMKNFKPSGFYKKRIRIESIKQIETTFRKSDVLRFFPEGGNLVAGTSNRIVVIGPPSAALQLRSPADSAVNLVALDSTGLGSFMLSPKAGIRYHAEWPSGGRRWPLPATQEDGLSILMETNDKTEFVLSVPVGSQLNGKEVFAVVVSQGKIKYKQSIVVNESQPVRMSVPLQPIDKSLHEILFFDSMGKILSRRLFFLKSADQLAATLNITTSVSQRGRVSGAVRVLDAAGNALESEVNVVVYQSKLFEKYQNASNIYLSDVPSAEERANQYGINDNFLLNDFLVTQERDLVSWPDIVNSRTIRLNFPFYSEAKLRGKVVSKKTGEAPPDSTAVIGYLQSNTVGYEAYTRNGNFEITLIYDFWGADKVFCTLEGRNKISDENYDIIIVNDSIAALDVWTSVEREQRSIYGEYALNRNIVSKSYSFFGKEETTDSKTEQSPNDVFEDEFRGADYEVNVEEYMTFPSMAEFLQEAVPFVRYRKKGDQETVRMSYRYEKTLKVFKNDPLYIIDGLMTKNTAYFLSLKPEQLLFIKILNHPNKLMQLGKLGENAVVFVESKKGDLYKPIENDNIFPVTGLSRALEFFEYDHREGGNARVPDLRSTLFWKPLVETRSGVAEFNFFASDDIGPMKVVVTGFTKDGRVVRAEKDISVEFDVGAR